MLGEISQPRLRSELNCNITNMALATNPKSAMTAKIAKRMKSIPGENLTRGAAVKYWNPPTPKLNINNAVVTA